MSRLAVLGEELHIRGFGLAGAELLPAERPEDARRAWDDLPDDVGLIVLTPMAAAALTGRLGDRPRLLHAVLPR
jgi:vacuolar-type H+-ATPase subunit F/Vma7